MRACTIRSEFMNDQEILDELSDRNFTRKQASLGVRHQGDHAAHGRRTRGSRPNS